MPNPELKNLDEQYILNELAGIVQAKGDPEIAHSFEDALYRELLNAIAGGYCSNPAECARLALTSQELDLPRYTS